MPLFGPNIKKLTMEKDLPSLRRLLTNKDLRVCLEVLSALGSLQDVDGLLQALESGEIVIRLQSAEYLKASGPQGISQLVRSLLRDLQLGNTSRKLEAMLVIQGRVPIVGVPGLFGLASEGVQGMRQQGKIPMDKVHEALQSATQDSNLMVGWFAIVTLIELGARDTELPGVLATSAKQYIDALKDTAYNESEVAEETIRALHYFFSTDASVGEMLASSLSGSLFSGDWHLRKAQQCAAVCAFAADGSLGSRERLEYLANRGDGELKEYARLALGLLGKASYDQIHKAVHHE
jgi:hypothetical protein